MSDEMIITLGGFIVMAIAVIKPILNLNTNITALKISIDQFKQTVDKLDARITEHGKELDHIKEKIVNHEARIDQLEKR